MSVFDRLRRQDTRNETRIFWSEIAIIAIVALMVTAYVMVA
jgi:hypothetical protein